MRFFEINEQFEIEMKKKIELDKEYETKTKGDAYKTRSLQILNRLNDLKKQALQYGTTGTICHIHGVRHRPNRRNGQVMIKESFNLYLTNITEQEAPALVKLHVKNAIHYTISFIRPGLVITT